jgi:hypothetical protein
VNVGASGSSAIGEVTYRDAEKPQSRSSAGALEDDEDGELLVAHAAAACACAWSESRTTSTGQGAKWTSPVETLPEKSRRAAPQPCEPTMINRAS